jgi:predicted dehydrogenase
MIKIGLLGSGPLAENHLKIFKQFEEVSVTGVYDKDEQAVKHLCRNGHIRQSPNLKDLIAQCDALVISTNQLPGLHLATLAIKNSKHLFLAQAFRFSAGQLIPVMKLADEAHVLVQAGFNERFNPVYQKAIELIHQLQYLEISHTFPFSGEKENAILLSEYLPGDIDLIGHLVNAGIKKISTAPVHNRNEQPIMISVRLEFDNGVVANLSIGSRVKHRERKIIAYQADSRIHIDLLNQHLFTEMYENKKDESNHMQALPIEYTDPGYVALKHFIRAIQYHTDPEVKLNDVFNALHTTQIIERKFQRVKVL